MTLPGFLLIAKKEYLDKVRNRWILVLSTLFALLGVVMAYFGAAQTGEVGIKGFQSAVLFLTSLMSLLIPLIALILGYGTIAGEDENGSLGLLMSLPLTRRDVIAGKFLGLGGVMATTVVAGLGVAGIVIGAVGGSADVGGYIAFMLIGVLQGLVFLALAMLLSSKVRKRSTAIGGAIFVWFMFNVVYDLVVLGIHIAGGGSYNALQPGQNLPRWYWTALSANPMDASQFAAMIAVGVRQVFGFFELPDYLTWPPLIFVLAMWTIVPLALSFILFQRRDV